MCDPVTLAVASFGLQAGSAYMQYQGEKDMAEYNEAQNLRSRKAALKAYGEDQMRIEAEQVAKNEESSRELFKNQRDKREALHEARASAGEGQGMLYALMRDIGFDYDYDANLLQSGIDSANRMYIDAEKDAYAAMERNWYNLPPVHRPSALGLAINVASAGVNSYSSYKKGDYGQSSSSGSSTT